MIHPGKESSIPSCFRNVAPYFFFLCELRKFEEDGSFYHTAKNLLREKKKYGKQQPRVRGPNRAVMEQWHDEDEKIEDGRKGLEEGRGSSMMVLHVEDAGVKSRWPRSLAARESFRQVWTSLRIVHKGKNRVALAFVILATLVKVLDTLSDVLVTVEWWRTSNQPDRRRTYGPASVVILVLSGVASGGVALNLWRGQKEVGFVLVLACALLNLNVVPWALMIGIELWKSDVPPVDFVAIFADAAVGTASYNWLFLTAMEFMFEAVPQLLLQGYVAAYELFDDGKTPSMTLQFSLVMSSMSIAVGLATTYLNYETLHVQCWGVLFFLGFLVARVAIIAFSFVEFGLTAFGAVIVIIIAIRLGIFLYMGYGHIFPDDEFITWGVKILLFPVVLLSTFPALCIEMIVPLGSRNNLDDLRADTVVLVGSMDRSGGMGNAVGIIAFGQGVDSQGVRNRLISPLASVMMGLHFIENLIIFTVVLGVPHVGQRSKVGPRPLVAFVLLPLFVSACAYVIIRCIIKRREYNWILALEGIAVRLNYGLSALPRPDDAVLKGLFDCRRKWNFVDDLPTVAKCDALQKRIHDGTINDRRTRKALDLLLLGKSRLQAQRTTAHDELAFHIVDRLPPLPGDLITDLPPEVLQWLFDAPAEKYSELKRMIASPDSIPAP